MKPGEEMHSAMEEVELDPCELYLDLGALLMEGRIPGLSERGFGEGPHCPHASQQGRPHQCDPNDLECQRYEQIQKHMLLLWKNGIPMSIEVLLYPSCCVGSTTVQSMDASSVPEVPYLLLEQWTIHMLPRRVLDANITPRGLIQAIRSFLYFSQLCAWLSLSGGKSPQNIHYRVCVPGEAFSSKFSVSPDTHVFPIANVGRNSAMKVLVKSNPRCGEVPTVFCPKHSILHQSPKAKKQVNASSILEELPEQLLEDDGDYICDGIVPLAVQQQQQHSRTSSPADSMLGESLLDPPNSLAMYPKRYQSPSRCGSPSLEVPEHLMFGKGATVKREAEKQRFSDGIGSRSRSQRRSVVERALAKTFGEDMSASSCNEKHQLSDKWISQFNDSLKIPNMNNYKLSCDSMTAYLSIDDDDFKTVPKAEMETVLHRLRNRCANTRKMYEDAHCSNLLTNNEKYKYMNKTVSVTEYLQSRKVSASHNQKELNSLCSSSTCSSDSLPESNDHFSQNCNLKYTSKKVQDVEAGKERLFKNVQNSLLHHNESHSLKSYPRYDLSKQLVLKDVKNLHHNNFHNINKDSHFNDSSSTQFVHKFSSDMSTQCDSNFQKTYQEEQNGRSYKDYHKPSTVNIKKYSETIQDSSTNYKLSDERAISEPQDAKFTLHHGLLKSDCSLLLIDDGDLQNHVIPSAEEKAKFRRSLDSATSLVFHKKSGLPLTSSPAPIRKSGTCFDFDSSITSVSAIKRALFEKQPEDEEPEVQKRLPVSYSAPASITVSSLLGTFEESVLNGRLEPVSTVEGFTAEIGASGSFCPRHITLPVTVFFYTLQETDKVTSPYLGHINLGKREYHVPKAGTVQVTLFNPHHTVVKMYVVRYDLCDMPPNCQTFLRQRTLYMPTDASENDPEAQKWLRYLIHLRFASSKSGRIYLHTDIRVIIFRKSDLDAAAVHGQRPYELRSFTHCPVNPKFSPRKP